MCSVSIAVERKVKSVYNNILFFPLPKGKFIILTVNILLFNKSEIQNDVYILLYSCIYYIFHFHRGIVPEPWIQICYTSLLFFFFFRIFFRTSDLK